MSQDSSSYDYDNYHYASSSSQPSECSVEPGSVEDVSTIVSSASGLSSASLSNAIHVVYDQIKIVGNARMPFAVRTLLPPKELSRLLSRVCTDQERGSQYKPGFSSTPGVQIALTRLNNISIDSDSQTTTFGPGLIYDELYAALEEHGVMVLGSRATGIGVGGFILGGGKHTFARTYFEVKLTLLPPRIFVPVKSTRADYRYCPRV